MSTVGHRYSEVSYVTLLTILTEIISSGGNVENVLSSTVGLIQEILRVERCSILLLDPATQCLKVAAALGIPPEDWEAIQIPLGQGIAGEVARTGEGRLAYAEEAAGIRPRRPGPNPYISVPLIGEERIHGVISITDKFDGSPLGMADLEGMKSVGRLLSVTLDRSYLHRRLGNLAAELTRTFENLPVGILRITEDGEVRTVNGPARRLLEWKDAGNDVLAESIDPAQAEVLRGFAREAIAQNRKRRVEVNAGGKEDRPLEIRVIPVAGGESAKREAVLIIEDLSLTREVEELRRIDEMKNNFISIVSHELRTPLTSIRGATNLLSSQYFEGLGKNEQSLIEIVAKNVARLASLVNTILDISLLDQNQLELVKEPGDFSALVKTVLDSHRSSIRKKNLTVELRDMTAKGEVPFDPGRMRLALDALLDNAVKFSPVSGQITLTLEDGTGALLFRVRDEGRGIAADFRERAFEKFTQGESHLTRGHGGTGLGLYLARSIVQLHGGRLTVEDTRSGACLRMELPMG